MIKLLITAVHLAALSQVESGDRDSAIGFSGEVSRYQIDPGLWRHVTAVRNELGLPSNPKVATEVATDIWEVRLVAFQYEQRRNPTLTELYLLWHRPHRVLRPRAREMERAQRFANLVQDYLTAAEGRPPINAKSAETGKSGVMPPHSKARTAQRAVPTMGGSR